MHRAQGVENDRGGGEVESAPVPAPSLGSFLSPAAGRPAMDGPTPSGPRSGADSGSSQVPIIVGKAHSGSR